MQEVSTSRVEGESGEEVDWVGTLKRARRKPGSTLARTVEWLFETISGCLWLKLAIETQDVAGAHGGARPATSDSETSLYHQYHPFACQPPSESAGVGRACGRACGAGLTALCNRTRDRLPGRAYGLWRRKSGGAGMQRRRGVGGFPIVSMVEGRQRGGPGREGEEKRSLTVPSETLGCHVKQLLAFQLGPCDDG